MGLTPFQMEDARAVTGPMQGPAQTLSQNLSCQA